MYLTFQFTHSGFERVNDIEQLRDQIDYRLGAAIIDRAGFDRG